MTTIVLAHLKATFDTRVSDAGSARPDLSIPSAEISLMNTRHASLAALTSGLSDLKSHQRYVSSS